MSAQNQSNDSSNIYEPVNNVVLVKGHPRLHVISSVT